jgi:DNA polymerase I
MMEVVSRAGFDSFLREIAEEKELSLDLETTGLSARHGDRLFSMAIAGKERTWYLNFQRYEGLPQDLFLTKTYLKQIEEVFEDPKRYWFIHNAKFDMAFLFQEGIEIKGQIHCTYVGARLENNTHEAFSLSECGERIGVKKDETVDKWITVNGAFEKRLQNDKVFKAKDFTRVPFQMISEYACQDARVCFELGKHQLKVLEAWETSTPAGLPLAKNVLQNENELTPVLFHMEQLGAKIDLAFCHKALYFEQSRMERSKANFQKATGQDFKTSGKLFQEVFNSDKENWLYTKKQNPSFVAEALKNFSNEAAQEVLNFKDAKNRLDFFQGFLFHADKEGAIHTSFNPGRAKTGRFSSSNPNLQNLKRPEEGEIPDEFAVRRAIVPRPGFFFAMIDYSQCEYRMMLDQAGANRLIDQVLSGLDVHQATANVAGVSRSQAKTVNFLTLYGGGIAKLASDLETSEDMARKIQGSIFKAAPEIKTFIRKVIGTAEDRGFVFNWFGRRYYFPDKTKCYRAPNYLIQGGAADVLKIAMVRIHKFLESYKSRMVLTIHDELVFEIAFGEEHILPKLKNIMETVYPARRLGLIADVSCSYTSLAEKKEWKDSLKSNEPQGILSTAKDKFGAPSQSESLLRS